ncbi:MAG TPA: hypothetical protein VEZ43_00170 [Dongiaceae bacterium]|nr:hypothetical protein [Dongiaceae bacterium]
MSATADPITVRELKDYADQLARDTRSIADALARDTESWRASMDAKIALLELKVENRLSKLEVKMNIIAFLAGTGAVAGIADLIRLMIH